MKARYKFIRVQPLWSWYENRCKSIQDRKEYSTNVRTIQSHPDITQQKEFQM